MTLADVKNALLGVLPGKVYHHIAASGVVAPYIVWAEDGQSDSLYGDGKMVKQVIEGTVDLFTKQEYDPLFSKIQGALNNAGVSFRLNSVQFEEDSLIFHHEWVFSVPMGV